jgi:hypothetical protein
MVKNLNEETLIAGFFKANINFLQMKLNFRGTERYWASGIFTITNWITAAYKM